MDISTPADGAINVNITNLRSYHERLRLIPLNGEALLV